jgi:hypothetical protein
MTCTPERRAQDPCGCDFEDCEDDADVNYNICANVYYEEWNAGNISPEEAQQGFQLCLGLADDARSVCREIRDRCTGAQGAPKRFSAEQKASFGHASNACSKGATVLGIGGTAAVAIGVVITAFAGLSPLVLTSLGVVCGAGAAGFAWAGSILSDLSIDPPDPDYDTISQPEPPTPPTILSNEELSEPTVTALNAVLTNQAQSVGLGRAVVTAINKASAAEAANDLEARDRQLTASRGFAAEWANVVDQPAPLRQTAATRLADAIGSTPISKMEAIALRNQIVASGWPTQISDRLADYGISGQFQEEILRTMRSRLLDLSALTVSLPDMIAASDLNEPENAVVAALREFAAQ